MDLINIDTSDLKSLAGLAESIAIEVRKGDFIALIGSLGAGKTTFAREFINARALLNNSPPPSEIPSPTFSICLTYNIGDDNISHYDLYRISNPIECRELGFDEALDNGIVLVEWPNRMGSLIPSNRLEVSWQFPSEEERLISLSGKGEWKERAKRLESNYSRILK